MIRSVLKGTGSALPRRVMTNEELAQLVDTSDEWIRERTGICTRYIAGEGETTGTLATDAARAAPSTLRRSARVSSTPWPRRIRCSAPGWRNARW